MKNQFLSVACCAALICANVPWQAVRAQAIAEAPAMNVKAIELNRLSADQYQNNVAIWQDRVEANPTDADSWLNLYKSLRYSQYTDHSRQPKDSKSLNECAQNAKQNIGDTFQSDYIQYLHLNKADESFSYLQRAYEKNSNNMELWDDMLCKAVIDNDAVKVKTFAKQLGFSNIYSASEMQYNSNVLSSVEANGNLVTYGNVDTYPLYILQADGIRKDVQVICIEWLRSERYKQTVFAQLGIAPTSTLTPGNEVLELAQKTKKTLHFALTIPPKYLHQIEEKSYLTGLALRYSSAPFDNMSVLRKAWEESFRLDHMTQPESINRNYVLPLTQLSLYFKSLGDNTRAEKLAKSARELAGAKANQAKVDQYLD